MTAESDIAAAEYVVGTLSADERRAFEDALMRDPAAQREVAAWQRRLAPLALALDNVAPPDHLWDAIERSLPNTAGQTPPPALLLLRRSRNRWRTGALLMGALAAGFAAFTVDRVLKTPQAPRGDYVAVVNRTGDQPALIIRVDLASQRVFVRPVATNVPQGRSLELWYIGNHEPPKSMGLVDKANRSIPWPAGATIEKADFAVSVEPKGGSPTGAPTGPVIYSGQLLKE
jgi:anti-sigma-K factor RskA